MRNIEVEPATLPTAAEALRWFAADVEVTPTPVTLPGALADAVPAFIRTTARDVAALAAQARDDAVTVDAAAETYRQLEQLLIPAAVR